MKPRNFAGGLAVSLIASVMVFPATQSQATASPEVAYYISKPFVQNSYLSGQPGFFTETFDNAANCAQATASGNISITGNCKVETAKDYGGAMTTSAEQVVVTSGPTGTSNSTKFGSTDGTNVTLSVSIVGADIRYLGFWWSAGNNVNRVTFYSGSSVVLTVDSGDLAGAADKVLGAQPTPGSVISAGSPSLRIGGQDYIKQYYWGNPNIYTSLTPTSNPSGTREPFAYIHFFATGDTSFSKVDFFGSGFEFDNLVLSSQSATVDNNELFLVGRLTSAGLSDPSVVTFDSNYGSPSSTTFQRGDQAALLDANTFTRTGYTFAGWNTDPAGAGTTYSDQSNYSFASSISLYAQWIMNNVTFDPNNGSGSMPNQSSTESASLSANVFSRAGFEFIGWNTLANGLGTSYSDQATFAFSGITTLYAQWRALETQPDPSVNQERLQSSARYTGPLLTCDAPPLSPNQVSEIALAGTKLDQVLTAEVDGKPARIVAKTAERITLEIPSLAVGHYAIRFTSNQGVLITQDCIKVQEPVTPSASPVAPVEQTPKLSPYFEQRRFPAFLGDLSVTRPELRTPWNTWSAKFTGVTTITCIGSTSGVPAAKTDAALARSRAKQACDSLKRRFPTATFVTSISTGKGVGQFYRAVIVQVRGQR